MNKIEENAKKMILMVCDHLKTGFFLEFSYLEDQKVLKLFQDFLISIESNVNRDKCLSTLYSGLDEDKTISKLRSKQNLFQSREFRRKIEAFIDV